MALIVVFVNKSELAPVSDYEFTIMIGDGTPSRSHVIASGNVTGHTRSDGWRVLVQKLLEQTTAQPRDNQVVGQVE